LPSLSDSEDEDEDETEEFDHQTTLGSTLRSMCRTHHTLTTHRQGRAVVSFDDDDGGDGHVAVGDDVDWEDIQEEDEE